MSNRLSEILKIDNSDYLYAMSLRVNFNFHLHNFMYVINKHTLTLYWEKGK